MTPRRRLLIAAAVVGALALLTLALLAGATYAGLENLND